MIPHSFRNCSWNDLREALLTTPWLIYDDIDDMWIFFQATLQHCLDHFVPIKKVYCKYSRQPTPWLTLELFTAIYDKQRAKACAECTRDPSDF